MAAIAATSVIAVLAVAVAVISYRSVHSDSGVSPSRVSALEARVDELAGQLSGASKAARTAARQAKAAAAAAKKAAAGAKPQNKGLSTCLVEVQREIDDLQAYLAYGTSPRRDRVSGACAKLLQPRFHS